MFHRDPRREDVAAHRRTTIEMRPHLSQRQCATLRDFRMVFERHDPRHAEGNPSAGGDKSLGAERRSEHAVSRRAANSGR